MEFRPLIYFDHDGVLADFMSPFISYVNRTEGTAYQLSDLKTYHFEDSFGRTRQWWIGKTLEYCSTDGLDCLPPLPGAVEGLLRLTKNFRLGVLTSRGPTLEVRTREYIAKTFPIEFDRIDFSLPYTADGHGKSKGALVREFGGCALIEDSEEYARDAIAHGARAWLIRQPWTEHITDLPVLSWPELVAKLLDTHPRMPR